MSNATHAETVFTDESSTHQAIAAMQLYGGRPDPAGISTAARDWPGDETCRNALGDLFDIVADLFQETLLEDDLGPVLWQMVNVFHRAAGKAEQALDVNMQRQAALQTDQDGSEIKSVELEQATEQGRFLEDKLKAFESLREAAAAAYSDATKEPWTPAHRSRTHRRTMTAAIIDSRDFINAQKLQTTEILIPQGTRIALMGGQNADHTLIWRHLDRVKQKYSDMVLLLPDMKGAAKIAACWASNRGVQQVMFRADWKTHTKQRAPFMRDMAILEQSLKGLLLFPDNDINRKLVQQAKTLGIPVCVVNRNGQWQAA